MPEIIECVPNFSEGRNKEKLEIILNEIRSVEGAQLMDWETDPDHNRAVVTFVGDRVAVKEAGFRVVKKASELIDLNLHQGEHPRMGATDVLPFVPVSGVTTSDCVEIAQEVGKRIGEELEIPVFLYEDAAVRPDRQNLADVRRGEFEGLREQIGKNPDKVPDFGPNKIHPTAGAIAVGARFFLIAYNVNLGTNDLDIAQKIAKSVRSRSGGFTCVKALGFELKDRGIVQVSMNLVNYQKSPIFRVFELIKSETERYGVPIVGSEIVGLVPNDALVGVSDFYLRLENFSRDQIIENKLAGVQESDKLKSGISSFTDRVAAKTPTPGGGSVAALAGSLGAGLVSMVSRLTIGKKKYKEYEEEIRDALTNSELLRSDLAELIEKDANAFDEVMAAFGMPKGTDDARTKRNISIQEATKKAALIPLEVMEKSLEVLRLTKVVAEKGSVKSISDAGVGALMACSAVEGAGLNVKINLSGLEDDKFSKELVAKTNTLLEEARNLNDEVLRIVERKI